MARKGDRKPTEFYATEVAITTTTVPGTDGPIPVVIVNADGVDRSTGRKLSTRMILPAGAAIDLALNLSGAAERATTSNEGDQP